MRYKTIVSTRRSIIDFILMNAGLITVTFVASKAIQFQYLSGRNFRHCYQQKVNRMKLDILAIGVHPDDVELGCSGTLLNEKRLGKTTGILDLTQGELGTRGSIETRYEEAAAAAKALGVLVRENLKMRDGF